MFLEDYLLFEFFIRSISKKEYALCSFRHLDFPSLEDAEIIRFTGKEDSFLELLNSFENKELLEVSLSLVEESILEIELTFDGNIRDNGRLCTIKVDVNNYKETSIVRDWYKLLELFPPCPDMFLTLKARKKRE